MPGWAMTSRCEHVDELENAARTAVDRINAAGRTLRAS
jgi:hypothetical protein